MRLNEAKQWYLQNKWQLPNSFRLDKGTFVADTDLAFTTTIAILENNSGKKTFLPTYERLIKMIEKLKTIIDDDTHRN